jgi:hypothetical protein
MDISLEVAKDAAFTISSQYRVRLMIQRGRMEPHRSALADIDFGVTNSAAPRVLEMRYGVRCFSARRVGIIDAAFAVHPGNVRRYHLDRVPSIGSVRFPKRSYSPRATSQIKQSAKRLCFHLAP